MIPLITFNINKTVWIVISRILYSFGIMLVMTKLLSIVYRMISFIFKGVMVHFQKSYWVLYFLFIFLGVTVWNQYPDYFAKGYFVAEIIAYVLFAFWFLLDMHTTKCLTYIKYLDMILNYTVSEHKKYVDTYKNDMNNISVRKDTLVKDLEQYFPPKFLRDPLKDLRRDPDLTHIDKYLQKLPFFKGGYKGIDGLLSGQYNVNHFLVSVANYIEKLESDEVWMDDEKEIYDSYITEMEKMVSTIRKSGQKIETLSELGFDTNRFQEILEGDIAAARNNRKNIKQFWKINKKINKMRRKNYGR